MAYGVELIPDIADIAKLWVEQVMRESFKHLQNRAKMELPGMKNSQRSLEYTLAILIKCWVDSKLCNLASAHIIDLHHITADLYQAIPEEILMLTPREEDHG